MEPLEVWTADIQLNRYHGVDVELYAVPIARVGLMRVAGDGWVPDAQLRKWMPGLPWYPDRGSALDAMLAAVGRPERAGHYVVTCGYRKPYAGLRRAGPWS